MKWNPKATSTTPRTIDQECQGKPSILADHIVHNLSAAALEAHVKALGKEKIPENEWSICFQPLL